MKGARRVGQASSPDWRLTKSPGLMTAMWPRLQTPAGNLAFDKQASAGSHLPEVLSRCYVPFFVNSGTAALALALKVTFETLPNDQRTVIVPGYGCPDLAAAIHFAGGQVLLIDTEANGTRYDMGALEEAAKHHKVACIFAVEAFGIGEQLEKIRRVADLAGARVVRDCAQSVQPLADFLGDFADFIVFSFGRGKPVTQLGGGALLINRNSADDLMALTQKLLDETPIRSKLSSVWKRKIYNFLLRPAVYGWVFALFRSRLGTTVYHSLESISALEPASKDNAIAALNSYWRDHEDHTAAVLRVASGVMDSFPDCFAPVAGVDPEIRRLARLPMRVKPGWNRDDLIRYLITAGLCATSMYARSLDEILNDSNAEYLSGPLPHAKQLASELITLPLHKRITKRDLVVLEQVLRRFASSEPHNGFIVES